MVSLLTLSPTAAATLCHSRQPDVNGRMAFRPRLSRHSCIKKCPEQKTSCLMNHLLLGSERKRPTHFNRRGNRLDASEQSKEPACIIIINLRVPLAISRVIASPSDGKGVEKPTLETVQDIPSLPHPLFPDASSAASEFR